MTTKAGDKITTASGEDVQEQYSVYRILKDLIFYDNLNETELKADMNEVIQSVIKDKVFPEIHIKDNPPEERNTLILSRWVHRAKGTGVRGRIVPKGYNEVVNDLDDTYVNTDVSTAFLRAALGGLAA